MSARRGTGEKVLAWVYTGPLGHFWSTFADLGSFLVRELGERARRRLRALIGSSRRLS